MRDRLEKLEANRSTVGHRYFLWHAPPGAFAPISPQLAAPVCCEMKTAHGDGW